MNFVFTSDYNNEFAAYVKMLEKKVKEHEKSGGEFAYRKVMRDPIKGDGVLVEGQSNVIDIMFYKEGRIVKVYEPYRDVRMAAIDNLIEAYFAHTLKTPNSKQLDRLSDLIQREELRDPDPYKIQHNEYPVLSESQFDRRKESEVSLQWAEEVATDGRDYRVKTRDSNRKLREISGFYK
jgi:hypothetical protein